MIRHHDDVVRSAALFVELPGSGERTQKKRITPISGDTAEITDRLLEFTGLLDHIQLVVDPITVDSIEALAPVVQAIHNA